MRKDGGQVPFVSEGEPRRLIAFVDGEVLPDERAASRLGLILDCGDASLLNGEREPIDDNERDLAIVRVLSTPARLRRLFQLARSPKEGDWLVVELGHKRNRPLAWILPATNDYRGPAERARVTGMVLIPNEQEMPAQRRRRDPSELERIAYLMTSEQVALLHNPALPPSIGAGESQLQRSLRLLDLGGESNSSLHPRVLDVGQASCVALHKRKDPNSEVVGFFDVGAPLWFHNSSMPKRCDFRMPQNGGVVILSHWDFDHYAMALWRAPELRNLQWYAPKQDVGRNTRRFQQQLGANLHFIEADRIGSKPIRLFRCSGPLSDRNASGYVMHVMKPRGPLLLTGDASYDVIPPKLKRGLKGVTVPHHGGASSATPPKPSGWGVAVASYGTPNKYRHPSEPFLDEHYSKQWDVQRTAKHVSQRRGSRWL